MAASDDSAEVLSALRLGWYMAEVRGRNRPGGPVPAAESLPDRQGHVLPLRIERTRQELRIEAQVVLRKLACDLGVDTMTVDRQQRNQADYIEQAKLLAAADPSGPPPPPPIALITLIVSGSGNAFLKALFGVLGVAGLSAATVQAGLKNTAQSLLTRLQQDAYTDLVAAAIAEVPDKPGARRQDVVMTDEIRKRTLTTAADAAVP